MRSISWLIISAGIVVIVYGCKKDNGPAGPAANGVTFYKTYGGQYSESVYSVLRTSDSGYVMAGSTKGDSWITKVDRNGTQKWEQTYTWYGGSDFRCVRQTKDKGFILTGSTYTNDSTGDDIYLMKCDLDGYKLWTQTFGGKYQDIGLSVDETSDGGYIIAGMSVQNGILIKTDENGIQQWTKSFTFGSSRSFSCVRQAPDGGFIVTGAGWLSGNGEEVLLLKMDQAGNQLWLKSFSNSDADEGNSVECTSDGGYVIGGGTSKDVLVIKTDATGNKQWSQVFPLSSTIASSASAVNETKDGGFIVVGSTNYSGSGKPDGFLIKLNKNGGRVWMKTYGGSNADIVNGGGQAFDGGYFFGGETLQPDGFGFDGWLVKTDENGNVAGH
jgi:hypothetical protein